MSARRRSSALSILAALQAAALVAADTPSFTASEPGYQDGCYWVVPNVGTYNTHVHADWSNGYPSDMSELTSSSYTVAAGYSPYARRFDMVNLGYSKSAGALTLTVPGGQSANGGGPISSAQLISSYNDILYGSVRTVAMISDVPGVTHGFSMYSNDNQEIDFAFRTFNPNSVYLTNEQVASDSPPSSYELPAPSDATTAWHEYRVDWAPDHTAFFIDGELIQNITTNVPDQPGYWLWNSWSNGNSWTGPPPTEDAVLKIRSIDGYYNRLVITANSAANPNFCKTPVVHHAPSASPEPSAAATTSSSQGTNTDAPVGFVSSMQSSQGSEPTRAPANNPFAGFQPFQPVVQGFYLQSQSEGSSKGEYAAVGAGAGAGVSFVADKSAASRFTIDSSGNLIEQNPSSGLAANLNFDINVQEVSFDALSADTNFLNCTRQSGSLSCTVNGDIHSAGTCGDEDVLSFARTLPGSCSPVTLVPISA